MREPHRLSLLVAIGWAIGGCIGGPDETETSSAEVRRGRRLKEPCRGLMPRDSGPGDLPPAGWGFIDSAVVMVSWADLEKRTRGGREVFDGPGWAEIDRVLDAGLRVRLRVMAGDDAPGFVKRLGGPSVSAPGVDCPSGGIAVANAHDDASGCVPYFWTEPVIDEYRELMEEIGRRYDGDDRLAEVVDSLCMTLYAEVMLRSGGDRGTARRLSEAGLDERSDRECQLRALEVHDEVFRRTRTSITVNPWQIIDDRSPDYSHRSWPAARDFLRDARRRMGGRLVLQNNGLGGMGGSGCGPRGTPETDKYCFLEDVDGPKGFQTGTLARLGSEDGFFRAVDNAVEMGANFVELPRQYRTFDRGRLAAADRELEAAP